MMYHRMKSSVVENVELKLRLATELSRWWLAPHLRPDEFPKGEKRLHWDKAAGEQTAENERNDQKANQHRTVWWRLKTRGARASLVAQWLRICLPMQGTRVRALVWEDPTCHGATGPVSHNYWACASGACAPQQERPWWWEARAPWWRVVPTCRN